MSMLSLAAFLLAIGLLIAIHEYGHYRVAVACGVKVLRFSIGFGRPLMAWRPEGSSTEFVIGAFPLGGYVRMLDEREAPVAPEERHRAFNAQSLGARAAIVAAGPLANLALAVLLYALVNWSGMQFPAAVLASPPAGSIAAAAGLAGGERVQRASVDAESWQDIRSFEDLRWLLTRAALEQRDVRLQVSVAGSSAQTEYRLALSALDVAQASADLFQRIGLEGPYTSAVIGQVFAGSAAERAGLREGDVVRQVGSTKVTDGQQLRRLIRASVLGGEGQSAIWKIHRGATELEIPVKPQARQDGGLLVGKIGAYVGAAPEMVLVRFDPLESLWRGLNRTAEVSALTLGMIKQMLVGEASIKNLSGPLTIADFAGKSAALGWQQYLLFLALISVSLGVLNLLPLPVLDGGHLMYYLWEAIARRPVSDVWMERWQRGGVAVLVLMMAIALYNDLIRLLG